VEKAYPVQVIRMVPADGTEGGKPSVIVTVMNRGDPNLAPFAVSTLVVDAATGRAISQFRSTASGYRLPSTNDNSVRQQNVPRDGKDWR
jgi:hypothetical protein